MRAKALVIALCPECETQMVPTSLGPLETPRRPGRIMCIDQNCKLANKEYEMPFLEVELVECPSQSSQAQAAAVATESSPE